MSAASQTVAAEAAAVVVFGRDESGKPHASHFVASEAALAEKAADLMGMRFLAIKTEAERDLAARVPRGKVFASGRGFVPFVKAPLYAELEAACPGEAAPKPKSTKADPAKTSGAPSTAAKKSAAVANATDPTPQPKDWDDIRPGAVVLAFLQPEPTRWLEFQVLEIKHGDTLSLRLCDWPDEPVFDRHRTEVALLHPLRVPEPPLEPNQPSDA